jgi:hypothetical protein
MVTIVVKVFLGIFYSILNDFKFIHIFSWYIMNVVI